MKIRSTGREEFPTRPLETGDPLTAATTITHLARILDSHVRANRASQGLSLADLGVLSAISCGKTLPSLIARDRHLDPSRVTRIVDHLVNAGFIHRKESLEDRRQSPLTLTPSGQEALEQGRTQLRHIMEEILGRLPSDHRVTLLTTLQEVRTILNTLPQSSPLHISS